MAEQWEYKSVNFGADNSAKITNELNKLGDEGWEAVGISQKSNAVGLTLVFYVLLKRPQTEPYVDQFSPEQQALKKKLTLEEFNARKEVQNSKCRYCKQEIPAALEVCPNCWPEIKK